MANSHSNRRSWRKDPSWCGVCVQIRVSPENLDRVHSLMSFYQVDSYQELFEELLEAHDLWQESLRDFREFRRRAGADSAT